MTIESEESSIKEEEQTRKIHSSLKDVLAGAVAGAFAKTATAPIERVKLLLQLRGSIKDKPLFSEGNDHTNAIKKRKKSSAWNVAKSIYYEEGVLAFWRGKSKV